MTENPNPTSSTTTLFGGRDLPVKFEDGKEAILTVRQLRLRDYQKALLVMDDEIGLTALVCDAKRGVIEALHPDSYEAAFKAVQEVNKEGFFVFAARQAERAAVNLRNLPPELVEKMISSRLSPISPPARG